ncbi:MAG: DUF3168 domain-containing protein [Pseudomonadota bacterium]
MAARDPALPLQKALVAALKGAGVCNGRVYSPVPKEALFPYCVVGDDVFAQDNNGCWDQTEATVQVHIWDRGEHDAPGLVQAKGEVAKVRVALDVPLALDDDFEVVFHEWDGTLYPTDPDGLTVHGVVTFSYLIKH